MSQSPCLDPQVALFLDCRNYHRKMAQILLCAAISVGLIALIVALVAAIASRRSLVSALPVGVSLASLGVLFNFLVRRCKRHSALAIQQHFLMQASLACRDGERDSPVVQVCIELAQTTVGVPFTEESLLQKIALLAQRCFNSFVSKETSKSSTGPPESKTG